MLLLVSLAYSIALVIASLINIKDMPELGSSFDDKLYHVFAYSVFGFLWMSYAKSIKSKRTIISVFLGLILFGILLEILQPQVNPNRTFDTLDLASNCIGVVLGTLIARKASIDKLNIFKALFISFFIN